MFEKKIRPLAVACVVLAAGLVVSITCAIYFAVRDKETNDCGGGDKGEWPAPSDNIQGAYWNGAVAANGHACSRIGTSILMKGGSAVEAAVATLLCDGVTNPQSMGVGGGFLMTIYNRTTRSAVTLNARETAPLAASRDMYQGNASAMQKGGLSVAVPGELRGYWEAVGRYGSGVVSWSDLLEPTIQLCEEGIPVNAYVANAIHNAEEYILESPSLQEILTRPDGSLLREGDLMRRPRLAETLRRIADEGVDAFYDGDIGTKFVADVQDFGGIITKDDLRSYSVKWGEPVTARLHDDNTLYTVQLPGSGPLLAFILNILDDWVPATDASVTWQRVVEAFKYAYGRRTELGDPDFEDIAHLVHNLTSVTYAKAIRAIIEDDRTYNDPTHYGAVVAQAENHGTAHVSVVAPNGDAVAVTSTINLLFGAKIRSMSTGIILNDEMDDFSAPNITSAYGVPPSPVNFIAPGKRPLSSMCPTVVVDGNGDVRLVTGAAGGTKITTATALNIINNLWFKMSVKESIDARRIHHQIFPMNIAYEKGFNEKIITALQGFGHKTEEYTTGSFVAAIAVNQSAPYQKIFANSDFRRMGTVAGF